MIIHMLKYDNKVGTYVSAGDINESEWLLPDAIASFLKDSNVDISIYLRSTLLSEVEKNLRELETKMSIDEFINNYKHPLSQAGYVDFGYAIEKDRDMLFMPGDPYEMDINVGNTLLKFVFGDHVDKDGKLKQQYVLTYMNRVQ